MTIRSRLVDGTFALLAAASWLLDAPRRVRRWSEKWRQLGDGLGDGIGSVDVTEPIPLRPAKALRVRIPRPPRVPRI